MTQEEKQLLLQDLCARLPHGVILDYSFIADDGKRIHTQRPLTYRNIGTVALDEWHTNEEIFKPYLRPMSSMTEEEFLEYHYIKYNKLTYRHKYKRIDVGKFHNVGVIPIGDYLDWLNTHHFDYRGLIEKGLALVAPEGMYNIKNK